MEEKLNQISEEENCPNYNYEEFVRIINKDDNVISKHNKFEDNENKDYQKEFYFNSTQSSDVTSISFSQTENLSQTSENIFIPYDSKQNVELDAQKELKLKERDTNYFSGIENYFRKIYPEKFEEYKHSKNFLPKKKKENNINKFGNENLSSISLDGSGEKKINNKNNFQYPNNFYYYPINGNMIYYIYNNFYLNFLNIQQNQNNKNEGNKKNDETKREVFEEDKKERNKDNVNEIEKTGNKKVNEIKDEYDNVYIIKKRNIKNTNNIKNKNEKTNYYKNYNQERLNEKTYKDNNFHYYKDKNNCKYYNNNGYNKYNENNGKRKRKFYFENNFYKKKYHNEIYY